ncbi:hypothetical protein LTR66_009739 [Elasticomyces elasticus]|nr:hypothetical protein LTR66_009739 [Elasticomyces elasticus]
MAYKHTKSDRLVSLHVAESGKGFGDSPPHRQNSLEWNQLHETRRPLIENVTDKWQESAHKEGKDLDDYPEYWKKKDNGPCDFSGDENSCLVASRSRRLKGMLVLMLTALAAGVYFWKWHLRPQWDEDRRFEKGFLANNGTYGIQKHELRDIVQVETLDGRYIPGGEHDPEGRKRLVFVGDVHGCKNELSRLLHKLSFDSANDHLVLAGDMIVKGPDSPGVIDLVISLNASSVRGNHEDRILSAHKSYKNGLSSISDPEITISSTDKYTKILRQLKPHHIKYLKSLPLILRIPPPSPASPRPADIDMEKKHDKKSHRRDEILVVHAGLVPAVPLSRQDPFAVMNMRSIDLDTHVPSANRDRGIGWERVWGWYQDRVERGKPLGRKWWQKWLQLDFASSDQAVGLVDVVFEEGSRALCDDGREERAARTKPRPKVVVYGHDSPRGLNIRRWSKGLDSGCVKGGRLTALVIDARGREELVSVGCERH